MNNRLNKNLQALKHSRGFTLLEVLFAMGLLMLNVSLLAQAQQSLLQLLRVLEQRRQEKELLEQATEVLHLHFSDSSASRTLPLGSILTFGPPLLPEKVTARCTPQSSAKTDNGVLLQCTFSISKFADKNNLHLQAPFDSIILWQAS